jgi:hypothetical protein
MDSNTTQKLYASPVLEDLGDVIAVTLGDIEGEEEVGAPPLDRFPTSSL